MPYYSYLEHEKLPVLLNLLNALKSPSILMIFIPSVVYFYFSPTFKHQEKVIMQQNGSQICIKCKCVYLMSILSSICKHYQLQHLVFTLFAFVTAPFVTGKPELDGDPLEAFGGVKSAAKRRFNKKQVFYSELASGGKISWQTYEQVLKQFIP